MSLLGSQIEERTRLDVEMVEKANATLVASVSGPDEAPRFTVDDAVQSDAAVRACLKYLRVTPGNVPDDVTNADERIEWLCRPSGTQRRTVRLDPGWQKDVFGAMLGTLSTGERVALLPRGAIGYYYLEPGTNRKVRVTAEVASQLASEAVLFYKPLPPKPLTLRDLAAFILRIFDRADYRLVIIAAAVSAAIGLVPAWANNVAFGTVVPSGQANLVLPVGALMLGAAVSTAIITASRNLVMARMTTKLKVVTQAATFARVLSLPPSFFKDYTPGNLTSRIMTASALATTMASIQCGAGLTVVLSLIYIVQIAAYAPSLAIPALAIGAIQTVIALAAPRAAREYEKQTMEADAKTTGTVATLLRGIQKIKLAGAENRAYAKWAQSYADETRAAYNRPLGVVALPALVGIVGLFGAILIYYFAGISQVSVADYMAFNAAFGQVSGATMALAGMSRDLSRIRPMFELIEPIIKATPELTEDKSPVESLTGSVEVSGVSFRYGSESPYVLKDLSFKIRPGEYVAFVGKSGCGKSTIIRLLLGFEKPAQGSIFFGNYDVQKVDLRSLRQHIGVVMQDGKLLHGDMFNNITVSTPDATLDDAWEAAEIADIADDIRKMPMGMNTILSEGSGGISGGQRQRIMIARAVCKKRRILVLDEATSALDNVTQKCVSDSLETLNCTRIVVAHRLSTVRHCDRILVIDNGTIAEEGTYDELLARKGLFAKLVERQRLEQEG